MRTSRDCKIETLTLTGMKVKIRDTVDGLWFWVIVGADRKVMVFERDIRWIVFPGHRCTEMASRCLADGEGAFVPSVMMQHDMTP